MACAPIKLGRIYVKKQSAWGTPITSFADADAMDVQGVFIPSGEDEVLGQPVFRPQFGASPKRAGSRAGGSIQLTWVMTNFSGTTATNEHELIADGLGTLQAIAGVGTITAASTTDELAMATGNTAWHGQGSLVQLTGGGAQIGWIKEVDLDADPDTASITMLDATPNAALSVGPTITIAFDENNLCSLPFTIQSESTGANGSFRTWDAKVASMTITANSKAQLLCAATLTTLDWIQLDAVVAGKFSFPRLQLGPNINALSSNMDNDTTFCYSSLVINIASTLVPTECNGSAQGVSQLVTVDRMVTITERMLTSDVYADAYGAPGTTGSKTFGMTSKMSPVGSHAAVYAPKLQLTKTSNPVDLGGVWGVERAWEISNELNTSDSDVGVSTVKRTNFRISFG